MYCSSSVMVGITGLTPSTVLILATLWQSRDREVLRGNDLYGERRGTVAICVD